MLRVSWAFVKMKVLAYAERAEPQRLKARLILGKLAVCLKAYADPNPMPLLIFIALYGATEVAPFQSRRGRVGLYF
jgi:hypothetical protein